MLASLIHSFPGSVNTPESRHSSFVACQRRCSRSPSSVLSQAAIRADAEALTQDQPTQCRLLEEARAIGATDKAQRQTGHKIELVEGPLLRLQGQEPRAAGVALSQLAPPPHLLGSHGSPPGHELDLIPHDSNNAQHRLIRRKARA